MSGDIISILRRVGAIITDSHIVLTSGKHSSAYINKDALYRHTKLASNVGKMFAHKHSELPIDVVAGPAMGGVLLSQWTAYHLSQIQDKEVLGAFTEKTKDGNQVFTRGYDKLLKDKNVLIVEDLTTTGASALKVLKSAQSVGAEVLAVSVMVNRNPEQVNSKLMGVPFSSLGILKVEAYDEKDCPLCRKGIPINTSVGHGKAYLEARN